MTFEEFEKKYNEGLEKDGYGDDRTWIELPTKEVAEITNVDGDYYSCLLHDSDGNPMLPYINTNSLYEMYAELVGE